MPAACGRRRRSKSSCGPDRPGGYPVRQCGVARAVAGQVSLVLAIKANDGSFNAACPQPSDHMVGQPPARTASRYRPAGVLARSGRQLDRNGELPRWWGTPPPFRGRVFPTPARAGVCRRVSGRAAMATPVVRAAPRQSGVTGVGRRRRAGRRRIPRRCRRAVPQAIPSASLVKSNVGHEQIEKIQCLGTRGGPGPDPVRLDAQNVIGSVALPGGAPSQPSGTGSMCNGVCNRRKRLRTRSDARTLPCAS